MQPSRRSEHKGDLFAELAAAAQGARSTTPRKRSSRAAYLVLLADERIAGEERKKLKDIATALQHRRRSISARSSRISLLWLARARQRRCQATAASALPAHLAARLAPARRRTAAAAPRGDRPRSRRSPAHCGSRSAASSSLTKLSWPACPWLASGRNARPRAFVGGADLEDQHLVHARGERAQELLRRGDAEGADDVMHHRQAEHGVELRQMSGSPPAS